MVDYKQQKASQFRPPPAYDFLARKTGLPPPRWAALLKAVVETPRGSKDATRYHRAVEALLTPLFEPSLVDPHIEHEVEQGTKRIDIRYRNMAVQGFFHWFVTQFGKAPVVPVACKNYNADPVNPEIAQLVSRLHPKKGRLGLLVCRSIEDRDRFNLRCRKENEKNDNYIIGLDDRDLAGLVDARKKGDDLAFFQHLSDLLETMID